MQYHQTRNAYHNQEKWRFDGIGYYEIPASPSVDVPLQDSKFLRFDFLMREQHPEDKIVHFFTDDYMFERVWHDPARYLPILARARAVVAPDFSLYSDYPRITQIFNHFRKHWLSAYLTGMGVTVIPSPSWVMGDPSSFEWCFDGEPVGSTICVSTHGAIKGDERKRQFLEGWQEVTTRLQPKRIYLYGDTFPGLDYAGGELIHVTNEIMAAKRKYCRRDHGKRQE